ncbi:MAG: HD domain-containing protein [Eubacteriales bacterium]|nr:HD domain-containing protein [Eubacteriales bacterium]
MENNQVLYRMAVEIATNAHKGQKDKGGNPYINHPLKVAEGLEEMEMKIVAVLHDVLEDSDMRAEELLEKGFPEKLVEAICVLTHKKGDPDSYEEYIRKVKQNPIARKVKIEDIKHNLDLSRIPNPVPGDFKRCEKYKKALRYLKEK